MRDFVIPMPDRPAKSPSRSTPSTQPVRGIVLTRGTPCVTIGSLVAPSSTSKATRAGVARSKASMPPVRHATYSSKAASTTIPSAPSRITTASSSRIEGFPCLGSPEASPAHTTVANDPRVASSSEAGLAATDGFAGSFVSLPFGQIGVAAFEEKMRQARERNEQQTAESGAAQATSLRDAFKAAVKSDGHDCEEENDGGASGYEGDDEKFGEKSGRRSRKKSDGRAGAGDGDVEMS
jgi:hypothetical protein